MHATSNAFRCSAWLLFVLIAGVYWILAQYFPVAYVWMTYEDLYGEWMQMWLFVAIFILAALAARRPGPYRWFFVLLSLAGLYTFLEEISYGQRLLSIQSPDFFDEYNIQGETNLHNFFTGPVSTVLKDIIEYALATALVLFGFAYPLLLRRGQKVAQAVNEWGIAPPPLCLAPYFLLAAFLELGWLKFNEAEVAEILVGTGLMGMLLYYLFAGSAWATAAKAGFAYLALFFLLVGSAWATTHWVNSSAVIMARTEGRVINGYKKYALRFQQRERWSDAADFYRRAYEGLDGDREMLQLAVAAYKEADDIENYRRYDRLLIDLAAKDSAGSTAIDVQLSLAHAYAEIEVADSAQQYLDKALFFAAERVKRYPDNPVNHYWQGRALQQSGDYAAALESYSRAVQLAPTDARYVTAERLLRQRLAQSN